MVCKWKCPALRLVDEFTDAEGTRARAMPRAVHGFARRVSHGEGLVGIALAELKKAHSSARRAR